MESRRMLLLRWCRQSPDSSAPPLQTRGAPIHPRRRFLFERSLVRPAGYPIPRPILITKKLHIAKVVTDGENMGEHPTMGLKRDEVQNQLSMSKLTLVILFLI